MLLPFGEYRPDVADYEGQHSHTITNVVPQGDGYGPFPDFNPYADALAGACRGLFYARKADDSIKIFAATATKLYVLDNSTLGWTDVSKASGTYSTVSIDRNWQFAQFNNFVFAVQKNTVPQVFDLTSSTEFADLTGSPPQADFISIVNRFVVLTGIASPNVYRIQWSGLNATTTWTPGLTQSDFQDLADGGIVKGSAGGDYSGVIFQELTVRRMNYSPGSPYVFDINRISSDDGLLAPYSAVSIGDRVFYLGESGFKMLLPGMLPQPIGKEKVDRTFFNDVDHTNYQLIIASHEPSSTRVHFTYKSISGSANLFDKSLIYDWVLDRWSLIDPVLGEYIGSFASPGITLEQIDALFGSNVDTLTSPASFDYISSATLPQLGIVNRDHILGYLNGSNRTATLVTAEHSDAPRRIFVRGFKPITDASNVKGSLLYRETQQASPAATTETTLSITGACPQRKAARYMRGKIRIPSGAWTFASGVEPDVGDEGQR